MTLQKTQRSRLPNRDRQLQSETIADLDLPDGFTPLCGVGVGETEEELEKRDIDKERVGITEAE